MRTLSLRLDLDGGPVTIRLRRSCRARRYSLRVSATARDALLTMPERGSIAAAEAFVLRHGAWLAERLAALPRQVPFRPGEILPLRGMPHTITHVPGLRGVCQADGRLLTGGRTEDVARALMNWLKVQARRDFEAAVPVHAARIGRAAGRIRIGDPKSRWGSCSSTGRLAFSWRLVLAPPFVLDYVAAHEVAHLVEMNHAKRFWDLVATLCPNHDEARRWLSRHGPELHRYG